MLYGGVAVAAGLLGAGAAWWKFQPAAPEEAAKAAEAFWTMSFDSPDGKALPMSSFRGKLLLVNFWATWCPPCVEELPCWIFSWSACRLPTTSSARPAT